MTIPKRPILSFFIIYDGHVNLIRKGVVLNSLIKGEFIGEFLIETLSENEITLHPLSHTILLKINKEKLYELLSNDHEIGLNFLDQVTRNIPAGREEMVRSA
jgi:CRP-like cAMP-binding protein